MFKCPSDLINIVCIRCLRSESSKLLFCSSAKASLAVLISLVPECHCHILGMFYSFLPKSTVSWRVPKSTVPRTIPKSTVPWRIPKSTWAFHSVTHPLDYQGQLVSIAHPLDDQWKLRSVSHLLCNQGKLGSIAQLLDSQWYGSFITKPLDRHWDFRGVAKAPSQALICITQPGQWTLLTSIAEPA